MEALATDLIEPFNITEDAADTIPSSSLNWPGGSQAQLAFMRRVYDINLQRAIASGKTFVADVPAQDLATIEGDHKARRAAAAACIQLLVTVRGEIQAQGVQVRVSIASAYRSASRQLSLWQQYFIAGDGYYMRTRDRRRSMPGGEHGEAAAQDTAQFVRGRIGTPGFSNHNNALAVDFAVVENGVALQNRTTAAATAHWRRSWFWTWMVTNAHRFNYYQNTNINEPWHWEYRATPAPAEFADVAEGALETGGGTFRRLRESDVKYLALEGGGGKGFVYVGAIRALEAKGILRFSNGRLDPAGPIKGISGASAGAISALLLSIGYNANAIQQLMQSNNFNRFFDLPSIPSKIPQLGGCRNGSPNLVVRMLQQFFRSFVQLFVPDFMGARERISSLVDTQLQGFFQNRISQSDGEVGAFGKLLKYPLHYVNDVVTEMGIFSGCNARTFFDNLLRQKSGHSNLSFQQHYQIFGLKLVLTGTNLERGTSENFSVDTTPHMPVADAVRISMGLPFIFKPYRITAATARQMGNARLAGLWIDGGVRNNMPIRAFENEAGANPKTLGIRLSEETITPINNIIDMLMALTIRQGLMGSGEADISTTSGYRQQTVILSTRGLSLTEFNPPSMVVAPLVELARQSLNRYFDHSVPLPESIDDEAATDCGCEENSLQAAETVHSEELMGNWHYDAQEFELLEQAVPAPAVSQNFLDSIANLQMSNSSDINAYFNQAKGREFSTWFNQQVAGRQHWAERRLQIDSQFSSRFNTIWDNIPLMFNTPSINLVQFLSLMSIIINETGGRVEPISERMGRQGHPGIAYAFDYIPNVKQSYNKAPNRTAFSLFNDSIFLATHGHLPLTHLVANTADQVWRGQQYPQNRFPTSTQPSQSGIILEADFYKFRGRGLIQTTWRVGYLRIIEYVKSYTGINTLIHHYRQRWAAFPADHIATVTTNDDWDRLFQQTEMVIACKAIHLHNMQSGNYLNLPLLSSQLNGTGLGSLFRMGLRVSGGSAYAGLFKNRVLQLLNALS